MEGRRPPPKAEHPFPDKAEVWKIWGTPGRGPFGLEIRSTEEIRKGFDLSNVAQNLRHFPGLESGKKAQDPFGGIYFDDGRKLVPPSDDRINTNILGVVS